MHPPTSITSSSPDSSSPSISSSCSTKFPIVPWIALSVLRGLPISLSARWSDVSRSGPTNCSRSSLVISLYSTSFCILTLICSLHLSRSFLTSLFPDGSS